MMKDLKGKLAIDASALIELVYCEALGQKLRQALENDLVVVWNTEFALTELGYFFVENLVGRNR